MNLLLQGVVGSTAYGLSREGSDVDRLGVFIAPTIEIAGLNWHPDKETKVTTKPDVTLHEVGKYLRLALKCNPTVTELLWLPREMLEFSKPFFGPRLVGLRKRLLSEKYVRTAYGGYARDQARKLALRGDGSFSADTRKRTAKHARHLLRLLRQGRELLETGQLNVKVPDPEDYFAFDDMSPEQMLALYEKEDKLFMAAKSVLPTTPNVDIVRDYLEEVRIAFVRRRWEEEDND